MDVQPALPQLKVTLDWKAYYKKFAEAHGGSPVVYKGRQYFRDGWSYALEDYAGPEWPPPEDKKVLLTIQRIYWYIRWNRARNELMLLRGRYDNLKGLQDNKSVPLQQVVVSKDAETKKISREVSDWSPAIFEHTIKFLEFEVKEADEHLKLLKQEATGELNGHSTTQHGVTTTSDATHPKPDDVARPDRDDATGEAGKQLVPDSE